MVFMASPRWWGRAAAPPAVERQDGDRCREQQEGTRAGAAAGLGPGWVDHFANLVVRPLQRLEEGDQILSLALLERGGDPMPVAQVPGGEHLAQRGRAAV